MDFKEVIGIPGDDPQVWNLQHTHYVLTDVHVLFLILITDTPFVKFFVL